MTSRQPMVLGEVDSKHTWLSMDITNEESIASVASYMQNQNIEPNVILNLSGILHDDQFGPERTWRNLNMETMRRVFEINTFGVALLAKHLIPCIPRSGRSVFASSLLGLVRFQITDSVVGIVIEPRRLLKI